MSDAASKLFIAKLRESAAKLVKEEQARAAAEIGKLDADTEGVVASFVGSEPPQVTAAQMQVRAEAAQQAEEARRKKAEAETEVARLEELAQDEVKLEEIFQFIDKKIVEIANVGQQSAKISLGVASLKGNAFLILTVDIDFMYVYRGWKGFFNEWSELMEKHRFPLAIPEHTGDLSVCKLVKQLNTASVAGRVENRLESLGFTQLQPGWYTHNNRIFQKGRSQGISSSDDDQMYMSTRFGWGLQAVVDSDW